MITYEEGFEVALAEARRVGLPWEGENQGRGNSLSWLFNSYIYKTEEVSLSPYHEGFSFIMVSPRTGLVKYTEWRGYGYPDRYDPPPRYKGWISPREARRIGMKELERAGWSNNYNVHALRSFTAYEISNRRAGTYPYVKVHAITGEIIASNYSRSSK